MRFLIFRDVEVKVKISGKFRLFKILERICEWPETASFVNMSESILKKKHQVMDNMTDKSKRSIIYPFHKEGWKTMSGHLIISWLVGFTPQTLQTLTAPQSPSQEFVFQHFTSLIYWPSQVTVVPVYAVVHMLLAQPGQSLYFWLRG